MSDLWSAPTTPEQVIDRANVLFTTQALLTANRMGVFQALGKEGRKDAAALAKEVKADARALSMLADALAGLGYLTKDAKGRYANSLIARKHLVSGGEGAYLGDYLRFQDLLWEPWGKLEDAVRSGRSTRPADMYQTNQDETRRFIRAMHSTASLNDPFLAARLDLGGRHTLADVGGGPGTFAIHFAKQYPELRATVLDLPGTLEVTKEIVSEEPSVKERITLKPCDFSRDDLGGPYDVALVSHIIHGHDDHRVQSLLMKLRDALSPNGLLLVHDFFTESQKTVPAFASLFALNMLISTDGGRTWSFDELKQVLEGLGYRDVEWKRLGQPRGLSVVSAVSPRMDDKPAKQAPASSESSLRPRRPPLQ
ncbi:methyltransferase domain-containing protein [bacterium]|nr:methyltransferase domain-containing protein [bacterium]